MVKNYSATNRYVLWYHSINFTAYYYWFFEENAVNNNKILLTVLPQIQDALGYKIQKICVYKTRALRIL